MVGNCANSHSGTFHPRRLETWPPLGMWQHHLRGAQLKYACVKSITTFNRTPIFGRCVVWWGSVSKYHKDTCSREIALRLQNRSNYSTLNNEHNWTDIICIQLRHQQTYISDSHNCIRGSPIFNPIFADASSYCRFANATQSFIVQF